MRKNKELRQFQLKPCTVLLTKLSESEVVSVMSTNSKTCVSQTCHLCQKKFKDKISIDRHVKYYHLVKKCHKCEVCDKTFRRKVDLAVHSLVHKDKSENPFPCSYCPKRYRSKFLLKCHVRSHLNEKPFPCVQCGKAYFSQAALKAHTINFHNVNRGSFACNVCSRIYANIGSLQFYKRNIHDNPTLHKCKVCGKGFITKCSLTRHSKIHDPDAKVFECGFCDSRFLHRDKLTQHIKTHIKEKVECNLCNKQLCNEDSLRTHLRKMHCCADLANAFPCQEQNCTKKYATSSQLKYHMKKHLDYQLWPLQCNFCNKRFLRVYDLQLHSLSHTKENLFKCTQCPRQLKTCTLLKYHLCIHSSKTAN